MLALIALNGSANRCREGAVLALVALNGVEVVVNRDPTHVEGVGHVFNGTTQNEGATLVEQFDGLLLVLAAQRLKFSAQFALHTFNEAVQRIVELRQLQSTNGDTAPNQRNIRRMRCLDRHDPSPDRMRHGCQGGKKVVGRCGHCPEGSGPRDPPTMWRWVLRTRHKIIGARVSSSFLQACLRPANNLVAGPNPIPTVDTW